MLHETCKNRIAYRLVSELKYRIISKIMTNTLMKYTKILQ